MVQGGGICGAIHDAAGAELAAACRKEHRSRCATGNTVVTEAYDLPAKHVLHTVGPTNEDHAALRRCYMSTLDRCRELGLRSVALCCVSTGIYGFPVEKAAHVALRAVREWLEADDGRKLESVVLCCWDERAAQVRTVHLSEHLSDPASNGPHHNSTSRDACDRSRVFSAVRADTPGVLPSRGRCGRCCR